ncbi:MAG TPA: thiamine phosphate synthase, partial [Anaerolineae bacterium]|nr:thiamine phosphate synthase [Anaerolineae bacterium]
MVTTEYQGKSHIGVAAAAIEGGASIIQYREKSASSRTLLETAGRLRELTAGAGVKLIINDRVDIALAVGADGVHLGQDDMPLEVARHIMGDTYIIGISATNLDEAIAAAKNGADYIGLGPIYPTPSKEDAAPPIGLEGLSTVASAVSVPVVAIGGITIDNVEEVVMAGADGIAVISAVAAKEDMVGTARLLRGIISNAK